MNFPWRFLLVCDHRTLLYRGYYMICDECGWEDEWVASEDEESGPNGDWTIRTYREDYLKRKADNNPDYHWWSEDVKSDSSEDNAYLHYLKHVERKEDHHEPT